MWFNVLKLDLAQLTTQIQGDADADSINIQRDDKCKKKLLKVIEIMEDTDSKARLALPNILEEVSKESEYKNKNGEFRIVDISEESTIVAENSRYRFGFSVRSELEDFNNFEEIDEMVACQLLEALKVVLADFDGNVSKRKRVKNSEGKEIGRVEYEFLRKRDSYVRNRLAIYETSSQYFNVVSISHGGGGFPSSYETFEGYRELEEKLITRLFLRVYSDAFKSIRRML